MVSNIERQICYFGLFSIYSYTLYKFSKTKTAFDKKFHDALIVQGNKFVNERNKPNLKFVDTPNQKILILLGIENNIDSLRDENLDIVQNLIENFTPNCFLYEKDLKYSSAGVETAKSKLKELIDGSELREETKAKLEVDEVNSLVKKLSNMKEEDRIRIFKNLLQNGEGLVKDFIFDFVSLSAEDKRRSITGKGSFPSIIGVDFMRLRSLIRKRMINPTSNGGKDDYVTIEDMKKMSLKERFEYKHHQIEMNGKFNIYEDIRDFIRKEIENEIEIEKMKTNSEKATLVDTENRVNELFENVVIQEVNEIMINNILNNNKLYVGVVLVRNERLQNLYEKLIEYNKNLDV